MFWTNFGLYVLDQFCVVCFGAGVGAYRERKLLLLLLGGGVLECSGVFWNVVEHSGGRAHSPSHFPSRLSKDFATALTSPYRLSADLSSYSHSRWRQLPLVLSLLFEGCVCVCVCVYYILWFAKYSTMQILMYYKNFTNHRKHTFFYLTSLSLHF